MIVNMDGLSYEDRLQSLKLWSTEERRNRQDLTEVFKMSKGMTRIKLQELFTLEENNKGTRGYSLKLAKLRCNRDCWKHFFQTGQSRGGMGWISRQLGATSLSVFK